MQSLRPIPQYQAPSRLGYRFRRFMLSKTWWALKRVVLPLTIIGFVGFRIVTSDAVHEGVANTYNGAVEWVAFLPGLKIDELQIENATKLQQDEILQALDIEMPNSTLLLDRDELREKMSSFDEIGESSYRFGFNGKLYIELKPRVPEMIFYNGEGLITIDKTGHKVEALADRADRAELFVISGEGALDASEEALKIIGALKPYSGQIRGLVRMGERRWDVVFVNGARLLLPEDRPLESLSLILREHQRDDVLNRDILAYDMRDPERPVLRLSPSAQSAIDAAETDGDPS